MKPNQNQIRTKSETPQRHTKEETRKATQNQTGNKSLTHRHQIGTKPEPTQDRIRNKSETHRNQI